jgi:hypothetical protein
MLTFLRRRGASTVGRTEFCDSCAQVCTPDCRAAARREHVRAQVLGFGLLR